MPFRVRPDRLKNHEASCKHLTTGGIPACCLGVSDTSFSDDALKAYPIRDTKVKGGQEAHAAGRIIPYRATASVYG
jgi:hypothetical protein